LLPKNPHLADLLIARALRRRSQALGELDDRVEMAAHQAMVRKLTRAA
jgi:CobQ-like glutamine amidotransferase family enzyme